MHHFFSSRRTVTTGPNLTASYTYNALGQRVGKIVNGQGTRFFHDAQGHLLGEYAANGQATQEIVWLGDWPIGVIKNNTLYNVHTDHLGTPRKISRASDNQVIWTWESEAFGAGAPNQNPSGLGNFVFNLRFPGQYYDAETGLHYNYFRDYDPNHGRYIESDPIGLAGGINTYGYVGGNPVGAVDPKGLTSITHPGDDELPNSPIGIPGPVITRPGEAGDNDRTPSRDIGKIVDGCLDVIDRIFHNNCDLEHDEKLTAVLKIKAQKFGSSSYACAYRRKGQLFFFPQWIDRGCYPINYETCMVDTSTLDPKLYGK